MEKLSQIKTPDELIKEMQKVLQSTIESLPNDPSGQLTIGEWRRLRQLDIVLEFCSHETKFEDIRNSFSFEKEPIRSIVMKLERDRYIDVVDADKNIVDFDRQIGYNSDWLVRRNFDGDLLVFEGGYVQKKINEYVEHSRLKSIASQTLILTWVLAAGAAPVGLLALADLYWKYGWFQYLLPPCEQGVLLRAMILTLIIVPLSVYLYRRIGKFFK